MVSEHLLRFSAQISSILRVFSLLSSIIGSISSLPYSISSISSLSSFSDQNPVNTMVSVHNLRRRTVRSRRSAERSPPIRETTPVNSTLAHHPPMNVPIPPVDYTDLYSPYALTNGDNPGNVIIPEVLDGTNYSSWSVAMSVALDAKNKMSFIDGSLRRPPDTDPSFRYWLRCNSMVKSWLLNCVSKQIYKSILRLNDAAEIWKDLLSRFHITNLPRSYHLTQQI